MSSTIVTLDEIRNYVSEKGPVELRKGVIYYYLVRLGQALLRYPKEDRSPRSTFNLATRVDELLPDEGTVLLSSKNTKVIVLDEKTHSYREAALEISENLVVPTEVPFNMEGFKPTGQLITLQKIYDASVPFYPARQSAFLIKQILKLDAPVVEIGSPFDGYYPVKRYSM